MAQLKTRENATKAQRHKGSQRTLRVPSCLRAFVAERFSFIVKSEKMTSLPLQLAHVKTPPIKCQGIKTKLVPFIFQSIQWAARNGARWIEPFLGSGVVAFNLAPQRALLTDSNRHIIELYQAIQGGEIKPLEVREFLFAEGKNLEAEGAAYYYKVRERFNKEASPLDFLFLNRSCFNGVMRFNRSGRFNVPFGHKPQRFSLSYITKIVNQVSWAAKQMRNKDWEFRVAHWRETIAESESDDFVYLDPPYIGRHTDYYNAWDEAEAEKLALRAHDLPGGYAVSMWLENRHRRNAHVEKAWGDLEMKICNHFYHVGATENLRNEMKEVLLIKRGFAAKAIQEPVAEKTTSALQLSLAAEWGQ